MQPTLSTPTHTSQTTRRATGAGSRSDCWAAIDLGSNSFHLLLARPSGASFVAVERLKEKVQLLGGFSDGRIQDAAARRGLECLARFAQQLRPLPATQVKVMGTCALREAVNADAFIDAANKLLPRPVEVISGAREAELIYAAVNHHLDHPELPRLTIDIGGGSTEFAWGDGDRPRAADSVSLGCVSVSNRFFTAGGDVSSGYAEAKAYALDVLEASLSASSVDGAAAVFGTSGTIESVFTVLKANGWCREALTREAMRRLEAELVAGHWVWGAGLPGLAPDRVDIFPAGAAILSACFEVLELQSLRYIDVSLLQGMMCEAVVTTQKISLHEDSVRQLGLRFGVDESQAVRVEATATRLFEACLSGWSGLAPYAALLVWAARLHEIGAHISRRHYHRHGAYIVKHAEMPGFAEEQQALLALLIRGHRRSLPGLAFQAYEPEMAEDLKRLTALLRIAVILERSHNDADSPEVTASANGDTLQLTLPAGWLQSHPLSARELEVETEQLLAGGLSLTVASAA